MSTPCPWSFTEHIYLFTGMLQQTCNYSGEGPQTLDGGMSTWGLYSDETHAVLYMHVSVYMHMSQPLTAHFWQ